MLVIGYNVGERVRKDEYPGIYKFELGQDWITILDPENRLVAMYAASYVVFTRRK